MEFEMQFDMSIDFLRIQYENLLFMNEMERGRTCPVCYSQISEEKVKLKNANDSFLHRCSNR